MLVDVPGLKQPESCKGCNGVVHKQNKEGKFVRKTCPCLILKDIYTKLGDDLYSYFSLKKKNNSEIVKKHISPYKKVFFNYSNIESFKTMLSHYLVSMNTMKRVEIPVYKLLDIYFGKAEDYSTIFELVDKNSMVIIRLGDSEINHVKLDDVFHQLLRYSASKPKTIFWVISPEKLHSSYLKDFYSSKTLKFIEDSYKVLNV